MPANRNDDPFSDDFQDRSTRVNRIMSELLASTPRSDVRHDFLMQLKHELAQGDERLEEAQQTIADYEATYEKLTSPANRLGVMIERLEEDTALIALGEQEFVAQIDPNLKDATVRVGDRVKVNEAYAIVGTLGYHTGGTLVSISEALDDGRLRVSTDVQGQQGRILSRSDDLVGVKLETGDEVRVEPNFKVAIEKSDRKDKKDFFMEDIPELPWSKVGGQEPVIEMIRDAIELPLLHPELFARFEKRPLKGILLFGPPGCGKTLIGKATAWNLTREYAQRTNTDVREYFMYINGPKILNMWLGETERMVREIFATARQKAKEGRLVFIFIDEAESVLRTRSSGRWMNISNTVVPQFCAEMDGLVGMDNVVVMLTSNRPDYIDPAILRPERIDRKVKVLRPDRRACRDILGIYLHDKIPVDPELVLLHKGDTGAARDELLDLAVDYLWRKTEETEFLQVYLKSGGIETLHWCDLMSGALLKSIVERSKDFTIKRCIRSGNDRDGVTLADLQEASRVEFKENEIFPKSDVQEDWLKLLDHDPENVATVKPVRAKKQQSGGSRSSVI